MTQEEAQEQMYRIMDIRDDLRQQIDHLDRLLEINMEAGRKLFYEFPILRFRRPE